MKFNHPVIAIFIMAFLTLISGCNSKKETTGQDPSQKTGSAKTGGSVQSTPQDEADASVLKARMMAHVKAGEYSAMYKEASAGFKEVGTEQQFIAMWQNQLQETGAFKDAKEIGHTVRPDDKFLVFTYDVQYEKMRKALTLTFGRSKKGVMELTGFNQKEFPATAK